MITISKERMKNLLAAEMKLYALECGGVDNWTWYGYSIDEYLKGIINDYDQEDFLRWVDDHRTEDRESFIASMRFEDFAEYEIDRGLGEY